MLLFSRLVWHILLPAAFAMLLVDNTKLATAIRDVAKGADKGDDLAEPKLDQRPDGPRLTQFLLPKGHPRCRRVDGHLHYIDHSLALGGYRHLAPSVFETFVLCGNGKITWAAVSVNADDLGALAWRLAFRIQSPPRCGDRLRIISSSYSKHAWHLHWEAQTYNETIDFTCNNHVYPYMYRAPYRFARLVWESTIDYSNTTSFPAAAVAADTPGITSDSSRLVVSVHSYARFRDGMTSEERVSACTWHNGFWCGNNKDNDSASDCLYNSHRCNGFDDCFDAAGATGDVGNVSLSSDEARCFPDLHYHQFTNGDCSTLRLAVDRQASWFLLLILPSVCWLLCITF